MDGIRLLRTPAVTCANLNRINTSFHLSKVDEWITEPLTQDGSECKEQGINGQLLEKL